MTDFVMVTAISQFRIRYAIPVSEINTKDIKSVAYDLVTCQEVKEFSQEHLGETFVDSKIISEEELIEMDEEENGASQYRSIGTVDYFADWKLT